MISSLPPLVALGPDIVQKTPFFEEFLIIIPVIAWIAVHVIKVGIRLFQKEALSWDLFRSGGMPSAHSAFIMSVTCAIATIEGIFTPIFVAMISVSAIILYDAMHVRYQTGQHAILLNQLLEEKKSDVRFPTTVGHTPEEVVVGAFLGAVIGFILPLLPIFLPL